MVRRRVTNKQLFEELNALKAQVQLLQEQVLNQSLSGSRENSMKFLLAEFNELGEFWRHTDARTESGLTLFFAASAIIVSGFVYFAKQATDFRAFLALITLIAFALFVGGLLLVRRIRRTGLIKAGYIRGLNLIRRYFVDTDQSIADYLVLPISESPGIRDESRDTGLPVRKPSPALIAIQAWNSLLLGFVFGSAAWLLQPRLLPAFVIGSGIAVAILCFIVFLFSGRRVSSV